MRAKEREQLDTMQRIKQVEAESIELKEQIRGLMSSEEENS